MKRILAVLLFILLVAGAATYFFVVLLVRPNSAEMAPALCPGDNAIALRFTPPSRGDIIAFDHPEKRGVIAVRRVIGLPGDTVALKSQRVLLNGAELPRTKLDPLTLDDPERRHGRTYDRWRETLPGGRSFVILLESHRRSPDIAAREVKGGYFVLADNRNHGRDSRDYGFVPPTSVRGVVRYLLSAATIPGLMPRGSTVE